MDRTNEYNKIVQSTRIPQMSIKACKTDYIKIFELDENISRLLNDLEKLLNKDRIYETFSLQSKVDKIKSVLGEYTWTPQTSFGNDHERQSYENLYSTFKTRQAKYKLKLSELVRKKDNRAQKVMERREEYVSTSSMQVSEQMMCEESESQHVRARQQISYSISEIGLIMEEISARVSLQEESFKRIDELMDNSDAFLTKSVELVKETWYNVSSTRKTILKFFSFWAAVALVFWFFRR